MKRIKNILIFGATSKIAHETTKNFEDGSKLFLTGTDYGKLEIIKDDLKARKPDLEIHLYEINALDFDKHQEMFYEAEKKLGGIDCVLISHGTLPDNDIIRKNYEDTLNHFNINCTSVISISTIAANYFEDVNAGTLAVISSVAGERGRQSNYIYGSAKSAVTQFLGGLRNRLKDTNVKILTIKPGPVDTPMTADMKKGLLFAKPDAVGKKIYQAIESGKDVLYVPWFWRYIMAIIKAIPESIFKKMSM